MIANPAEVLPEARGCARQTGDLIHAPIELVAERQPTRRALTLGAERITFGELVERVHRIGGRVRHGVTPSGTFPGGCVCLVLTNRLELLELLLGCACAGSAAAVLDPRWPQAVLAGVLADLRPGLLFVDRDGARAICGMDGMPPVIAVGEKIVESSTTAFDDWLGAGPASQTLPPVDPNTPVYVGFTSGTTGWPKGFVRNHRSWATSLKASIDAFGVKGDEEILVPSPLSHSLGLYGALEGLSAGATVRLFSRFTVEGVAGCLETNPITRLLCVPTMLARLVDHARDHALVFPQVRCLVSGGAKLTPSLKSRAEGVFPQASVFEYYGSSETSFVTWTAPGSGAPAASVGRPFPGVQVSIRGDDGKEVSAGEIGRLHLLSPTLFQGYLAAGDGTGFHQGSDGWATVGDRAWRDDRGFVFLAGRDQDMVITGGLNVYPAEVEAVLADVPGLADVAVVGVPDEHWGERLAAVVVLDASRVVSRDLLERRCREMLERHKCPKRWLVADSLPMTPTGKVARADLRDALMSDGRSFEALR